jgi:hypothetical protein
MKAANSVTSCGVVCEVGAAGRDPPGHSKIAPTATACGGFARWRRACSLVCTALGPLCLLSSRSRVRVALGALPAETLMEGACTALPYCCRSVLSLAEGALAALWWTAIGFAARIGSHEYQRFRFPVRLESFEMRPDLSW